MGQEDPLACLRQHCEPIHNPNPRRHHRPECPKTIRVIQEIPKDPDHRNLDEVNALVQACFASADYKEGRTAFMEKRRPVFQDV